MPINNFYCEYNKLYKVPQIFNGYISLKILEFCPRGGKIKENVVKLELVELCHKQNMKK